MTTTRGIRNNNPGNIDHNDAINWMGELPVDKAIEPRFCRFETPIYGLRALGKNLLSYKKRGINTVSGIIMRWAPSTENNTGAYIDSVADACGVEPTEIIDIAEFLPILICSIVKHENGTMPYSAAQIGEAVKMALVK